MAQSTGLQRRSRTMNTDNHGEENSPFRRRRLPSLNALRCRGRRPPGELFPCRRGPVPDPRRHQPRRADPGGGTRLCALRTPRPAGFLSEAGRRLLAGTGPALDLIERTGEAPARGGRTHRAGAVLRTDLADALADPADRRIHARTATTVDPAGRRRRAVRLGRGIDLAIRRNDFPGRPAAMPTGCSTSRSGRSAGRATSNGISTSMQDRPRRRTAPRRPARKPGTPGPVSPDRRRRRPKGSASSTST